MNEEENLEDLPLAGRLSRMDLSAASRVKSSLRARLLRKERGEEAWQGVPHARLAFSLALLALALLSPLRTRFRDLLVSTAAGTEDRPLPVLSGTFGPTPGADTSSPFVTTPVRVTKTGLRLEGEDFVIVFERRSL